MRRKTLRRWVFEAVGCRVGMSRFAGCPRRAVKARSDDPESNWRNEICSRKAGNSIKIVLWARGVLKSEERCSEDAVGVQMGRFQSQRRPNYCAVTPSAAANQKRGPSNQKAALALSDPTLALRLVGCPAPSPLPTLSGNGCFA